MNPFEAIKYVGTPIALVAFVAAIIAWAYRGRLIERRKLIETAPEAERGRLLDSTIRDFATVPTEDLTTEQRYNLANKLIDERTTRFRSLLLVSIVIALLFTALVVLFTVFQTKPEVSDLIVRVHGQGGSGDFVNSGSVTLDAGQARDTRAIGSDGQVRFQNVPASAYKNGVTLIANVPGYRAASATLTAPPANGAFELALEAAPTRVYGTVVDAKKNPVSAVVLVFQDGMAADTTDPQGTFSVLLPYPPGSHVRVRALKNGKTGYSDMITIPEDASLTIFFTTHP